MTEGKRLGRRLAAIVTADYSRLMGLNEVGTARTLREHRDLGLTSSAWTAKDRSR
jgi:hypothetical protein